MNEMVAALVEVEPLCSRVGADQDQTVLVAKLVRDLGTGHFRVEPKEGILKAT